jgi:hypothetical protein
MTYRPLEAADQSALDSAASLLDLVGRCADESCGAAAIHSLRAADLLVSAGAQVRPRQLNLSTRDVRAAITQALTELSKLSDRIHDLDDVADASGAAQRALASTVGR